ncbi:hypothetical protein P154DRAFT_536268 [Amniculicola lignicola CBS 123094]|uniref:Uncharacterized protein n=1 Tax=Amniculicola lignicola CBS 123094 TaxID=1392246 RepID=A0A6A5W9Z1_9PLEO|nr:hypothetical protein P154DRAFT_536268 [Amniculicola lignicola CBS 123094]
MLQTVQFPAVETGRILLTEVNPEALGDVPLTSHDRWRLLPWKRRVNFGAGSDTTGYLGDRNFNNPWDCESFDEQEMLQAAKQLKEAQIYHMKISLKYDQHQESYEEQYQRFRLQSNRPLSRESQNEFAPIFVERGHSIIKELKDAEDAVQAAKDLAMNTGVSIHWDQKSHFPDHYDLKDHQLTERPKLDEESGRSWICGIENSREENENLEKSVPN